MTTDSPLADIRAEAGRVVAAAQAQGLALRLLGGLAVALHAPSAALPALARTYADIDLVAPARQGGAAERVLAGLGYQPDREFNLLNGAERLLLRDPTHSRQVDVFVGQFSMCHRIPVAERLEIEPLTLPLAELLLTKLQIVQLNEKDLRDICALLLDHPVGQGDAETVNAERVARLCAEDWGLWRTVSLGLERARAFALASGLDPQAARTVDGHADALLAALEQSPKSLRWKLRAAVGERVQWYELPEEV
ncbi:MAG TPA: hypothetical protein VFS21_27945 [Roseiflexaceae bacterium]|nr:hypothetical protein [Roseiflexaceae bacterium]